MKLLFELSGEHPQLPFAELECVGEIITRRRQVAVALCRDSAETRRLALTHVVLEYLGECAASTDALRELLIDLGISTKRTFAARVKKIQDAGISGSQLELERLIGSAIEGPVSLEKPEEEYRAIITEDRCFFGKVLYRIDRGAFAYRNPLRRPFFHPGVMMPIMARALVNIALTRSDEVFFDPFCGTGGILLEAQIIGARVLGSDADAAMIAGCRENLTGAELMLADAASLPICSGTVDTVVTDLPYGQSVRIQAKSIDQLYDVALEEIHRILKNGKRAVVVSHRDIGDIAANYFEVRQIYQQRVHKSLTRRIMVLE